jgi:hypothetical protein
VLVAQPAALVALVVLVVQAHLVVPVAVMQLQAVARVVAVAETPRPIAAATDLRVLSASAMPILMTMQ